MFELETGCYSANLLDDSDVYKSSPCCSFGSPVRLIEVSYMPLASVISIPLRNKPEGAFVYISELNLSAA
ncbi:MAG: hypothetical protein HQK85_08145 [Nitrospinae bacterium]|nr:hypothetical protein [Nitrospinota bacterium]